TRGGSLPAGGQLHANPPAIFDGALVTDPAPRHQLVGEPRGGGFVDADAARDLLHAAERALGEEQHDPELLRAHAKRREPRGDQLANLPVRRRDQPAGGLLRQDPHAGDGSAGASRFDRAARGPTDASGSPCGSIAASAARSATRIALFSLERTRSA